MEHKSNSKRPMAAKRTQRNTARPEMKEAQRSDDRNGKLTERALFAKQTRSALKVLGLHPVPSENMGDGWERKDIEKSLIKSLGELDYADVLSLWLVACTLAGDGPNG